MPVRVEFIAFYCHDYIWYSFLFSQTHGIPLARVHLFIYIYIYILFGQYNKGGEFKQKACIIIIMFLVHQ